MTIERSCKETESIYGSLEQSSFIDITSNRIQEIILKALFVDGLLLSAQKNDSQGRPKFKISVDQDSDEQERLLTLVHEVVHIDRNILNGVIGLVIKVDKEQYDKCEEAIEEEAKRFLAEHQDMVKAAFEKLVKEGEKKES